MKCPLNTGIYEKLNPTSKSTPPQQQQRSSTSNFLDEYDNPTKSTTRNSKEPCKYLTQTQTLQVGCLADQQYSLKTKLCYPNHQLDNNSVKEQLDTSTTRQPQETTTAYTQLESEINLVCLAHWRVGEHNQVIVSRTMTNEILCSVKCFF